MGIYSKAIVYLLMSIISYVNAFYDLNLPVDEETIGLIIIPFGTFLIWLIPNKKKAE